jgi:diphthamide biosynthesis protein 2
LAFFRPNDSCCIDSLSAMHVSSDFLVHYGHACLTRSSDPSLRIRYVFPRLPISIPSVVDAILSLESEDVPRDKSVLVMYDVGYYWALEGMEEEVGRRRSSEEKGKGREVIFSRIELDEQEGKSSEGSSEEAGREVARESAYCSADPSSTSSGCCGGAATTSSSNAESKPPSSCCSSSSPNQPSIASTSCCQSQSTAPSSPLPLPQSNPSPSDPLSSTLPSKTASLRSYSLLPATSISDYAIFYIGEPDSLQIRNILVTHSRNAIYSYSPTTHPEGAQPDTAVSEEAQEMPTPVLQSIRTNRLLMRRYAIMQKARDADVFGLLVGNVNLGSYIDPLLSNAYSSDLSI